MSNDKLSELSKPEAFIVRSPRGDVAYRTISQTDADYIARKGYASEPLYSQEYVSALLAERDAFEGAALALRDELREARTELERYKQYAKERDAENESLALTVGRLRAKLATPVRLPSKSQPTGSYEHDKIAFHRASAIDNCAKAIRAAGFTFNVEGDE